MSKFLGFFVIVMLQLVASASWYWPFGSSDDEKEPPRLSELMEPASLLIEEASELAGDGRTMEAVEKYRAALVELDRIEAENPDRVDKPEFSTLKTKRAYVSAAINTMLLVQARQNARPVAVSNTTELERKLALERGERLPDPEITETELKVEDLPEVEEANAEADRRVHRREKAKERAEKKKKPEKKKRAKKSALSTRDRFMAAWDDGDIEAAEAALAELIAEKPNNAATLNLKAIFELFQEHFDEAEKTLTECMKKNPRDYSAYYNMAQLYLRVHPEKKSAARRYYETAIVYGCPEDEEIEEALK